jgi:hypothetical protein
VVVWPVHPAAPTSSSVGFLDTWHALPITQTPLEEAHPLRSPVCGLPRVTWLLQSGNPHIRRTWEINQFACLLPHHASKLLPPQPIHGHRREPVPRLADHLGTVHPRDMPLPSAVPSGGSGVSGVPPLPSLVSTLLSSYCSPAAHFASLFPRGRSCSVRVPRDGEARP